MIYTTLGARGPRVSRLGFGGMRLPVGPDGRTAREDSLRLLRRAVELGITYFDTAVGYCGGESQPLLGEALAPYRDRVVISTKNPFHDAPADRWRRTLEDSLRLLRTDRIDVYHFHSLTGAAFDRDLVGPGGKLDLMRRARDEGLVRHLAASVHDTAAELLRIAASGAFDVITLQYNLLNRDFEAAMHEIAARGIGIVVMGPVGGGRLGVPSERIAALTDGDAASTPEAALRFVLAHPAVSLALSGMSSLAQLEENVRVVAEKPPFTTAQVAAMDAELQAFRERIGVNCPACGYCLPCPRGVAIPDVFRRYNELRAFGLPDAARRGYAGLAAGAGADRCTQCGACRPKCPQRIEIPRMLLQALGELDPERAGVSVSLVPRSARGGALRVELLARNAGAAPADVRVRPRLDGLPAGDDRALDLGRIEPCAVATRRFDLCPPEGCARLVGVCEIETGTGTAAAPVCAPFFLVPEGAPRRHAAAGEPAGFGGDAAAAAACALTADLAQEGGALTAVIRARAPLDPPAPAGSEKGARLVVAVDGRPARASAPDAFGAGVARYVLRPAGTGLLSASDGAPAATAEFRALPEGGEWRFRLPLEPLCGAGRSAPAEFGLEIALVLADTDGRERGRVAFSGRPRADRHPRQFPPAFRTR